MELNNEHIGIELNDTSIISNTEELTPKTTTKKSPFRVDTREEELVMEDVNRGDGIQE